MANQAPYEIIMTPFTVYVAPVGETFPLINVVPAGNWTKFGVSGLRSLDEGGVKVSIDSKYDEFRGQSTVVRKVVRTEENITVAFSLADITLESIKKALGENAITTTAAASAIPGNKSINLYRGYDVACVSLLIRGASPYSGDANSFLQYELPRCYQSGKMSVKHGKGKPSMVDLEFMVLEGLNATDTDGDIGRIKAYTAAPLP